LSIGLIVKRFFCLIVSKPHNNCIKIEHVLIIYLFKILIVKDLFFGTALYVKECTDMDYSENFSTHTKYYSNNKKKVMIKNNFKIAFRNLIKNKTYSAINIGGLALGMASAALLLLWVQNELSYDGYHLKAKNLYRINTHMKINDTETWHWGNTPLKFAESFKENMPEIKEFTRLNIPYGDYSLTVNNAILAENKIGFVDNNWFQLFDYQFIKGNARDFEKDKSAIVLTESRAKKFFGDDNPIGKILQHDSLNFVVQAVIKDLPSNSSFRFEVLAQNDMRLTNPKDLANDAQFDNFNYQTFIVCNEGINTKNVSEKCTQLLRKLRGGKEDDNATLELKSVADIHLDSSIQDEGMPLPGNKKALSIFSIIALFILLIACINYINLTTAKAGQRTKEVGVRKVIGASKSNLFNQFFTESILTSVISAVLALILIRTGLPLLEKVTDNHFSLTDNPIVLTILGSITVLSIVLTGIYPAILLSSFHPMKLLRGSNVGNAKNGTFRKSLVVFQFTFTIFLLIATFLIYNQLQFIQNKNLGYDKERVFTFAVAWNVGHKNTVKLITEKLKNQSSIQGVTTSNMSIVDMKSSHSGSLNWAGKDPNWTPTVSQLSVSPNYDDFFKLKLNEGRWFMEGSKMDSANVILNETAINDFNIPKPALGQVFEFHGKKGQIIGITKDFHYLSPKEKIKPLVMYQQSWNSTISVKTISNQTQKALVVAEKTWKEILPNRAFKYEFLDESYANLHKSEERQLTLFMVFAGIVLLISCFGLFGLATFSAEVRTKEIGIRKVLGASVANITALLSKEFLVLVAISILIASPIAYYLGHKWLQEFAYRISIGWWVFVLAGFIALLIALLTVSFQAVKAAVANPVKSLRTE
jgi:putative ABC transport system permease protein